MAWTDTCKIEARNTVEKKAEEVGSIRAACKVVAEESGIPAETLRSWCKNTDENSDAGGNSPSDNAGGESLPPQDVVPPSQAGIWARVASRLGSLCKFMEKNCEAPTDLDPDLRAAISERIHFVEEAMSGGDE